jgi:hypothetical protein
VQESAPSSAAAATHGAPPTDPLLATPAGSTVSRQGGTLPPAGWSAEQLADIEKKLAPILGPMARVLIKRAAALTRDRDHLLDELSKHLRSDDERERFLKGARPGSGPISAPSAAPAPVPVPDDTAASAHEIAPATLDRTRQILTRYLGPIAAVLVKKTAPTARDEIDLYNRLAERISSPAERERFLAEMTRRG